MKPPKLLLTGFEPFGGSSLNPSEQAARALDGQHIGAYSIQCAILPVDSESGPAAIVEALRQSRPQAVLCLGQANRRAVLSIERLAVNLAEYAIPDNSGRLLSDQPVVLEGPAAYFVSLPVRKILAAVLAEGVPAELSLSAGTYLCNQVLYTLLHNLSQQSLSIPAGFIHLPSLPEQASLSNPPVPSMSLEIMLRGIRAAIAAIQPL